MSRSKQLPVSQPGDLSLLTSDRLNCVVLFLFFFFGGGGGGGGGGGPGETAISV